jgi:cysteine-rich repeat protein
MTLDPLDLGRSLFVAGALLLGCMPTPSEVNSSLTSDAGSGPGDTSQGPGSADSGTDAMDDTGPSFDSVCGDGIVELPEECDLGDLNGSGLYCTDECRTNTCGDGYVGPGEACDDGNQSNEDLCTTNCGPTSCGDGVIQGAEQCDEGEDNATDGACLPSCVAASCGDTFIRDGVETCDSNNIGDQTCAAQGFDDGVLLCAADCQGYDTSNCYACGNGVVEAGENCDGTVFEDGATCQSFAPAGTTVSSGELECTRQCTVIDSSACTYCGDGMRQGPEACDGMQFGPNTCATFAPADTTVSGGALVCNANCTIDADDCTYCGDDVREDPEVCDGDQLDGQTCMTQTFFAGTLACNPNCMGFDFSGCTNCGNGMIDSGEECDGAAFGSATCESEVGTGYSGTLACTGCTIDSSGCCLSNNQPCSSSGQCCSGNCTDHMGTDVCRP